MAYILMIEKNPWLVDFYARELCDEGHILTAIEDATQLDQDEFGIEKEESYNPEVFLLDQYLNETDVEGQLRVIRDKSPSIPVLVVTSHEDGNGVYGLGQSEGYLINNYDGKGIYKSSLLDLLESIG